MLWRSDRYEDDLKLARSLGSNAFRFSLEWSRVEPVRGQLCAPALLRYHKMIDCMIRCAQQLGHRVYIKHNSSVGWRLHVPHLRVHFACVHIRCWAHASLTSIAGSDVIVCCMLKPT